jgi:hypothetical protein
LDIGKVGMFDYGSSKFARRMIGDFVATARTGGIGIAIKEASTFEIRIG